MKKTSLTLSVILSLFVFSCKEHGPSVDFGKGALVGEDTVYKTTNAVIPQPKRVLVEEMTGVHCSNCPDAAQILKSSADNNGGNVLIIGYHPTKTGFTEPINTQGITSMYDFRREKATDVINSVFGGLAGMPLAVIDRQQIGGEYYTYKTEWSKLIEDRLKGPTPINIDIASALDNGANEAVVIVSITYTADVDKKNNLHVAIIENDIVDAQYTTTQILANYNHEHVFRSLITPVTGAAIPEKVEPKVAGKVYERRFTVAIDKEWNINNCKIIAYVTNNEADDKEVVQAAEASLVQ